MCGIGGILRTDGEPIPEEWLDAIDARIAYRGPDGHGRFRDRMEIAAPDGKRVVEVALVHRRLSIIDHADGAQPMVSERGRDDGEGLVSVVFNGCIYNHRELRKELEAKGHTFVTDHSDTEVLIHGHREWGEQLPDHLEGMYAYAIWDRQAATVTLARDWFGEKPLYYQEPPYIQKPPYKAPIDGSIAFSSSAASVAMPPLAQCDVKNVARHCEYLDVGYSWSGQTLFTEPAVRAIPPRVNVRLAWPGEEMIGAQYLDEGPSDHGGSRECDQESNEDETRERSPAERLEQLLDQAVLRRLEADVPLGCFLSGGVDSSLLAFFAKRHKPDLMTFSVRMSDERYDESHHAETVAASIGTHHTTLECEPRPTEDLVHLIGILGQPFGDSSILPTYWVSKAARQHVKVAISGDGGDELFIGYERYMAARSLARLWRVFRLLPRKLLERTHPKSFLHKLGRLGEMARNYPRMGIHAMESLFTVPQMMELFEWSRFVDWDHFEADGLQELRQFDLDEYLPNDLLTKVDTASMACALEVRCPFLDRDLAAAVLAMPVDQLIPGGKRKGLLRKIARKYLPREVVDRPKMGFAIPIGEWFRTDYGSMKTLLMDHLTAAEPFGPIALNRKAVQRFIDEHMAGKYDHGQRLFALLTLSIWARSL